MLAKTEWNTAAHAMAALSLMDMSRFESEHVMVSNVVRLAERKL
jgi:hypothetical protein